MAKPKEILIQGKDFFAWVYEEQTKIKHKVLQAYSKIWLIKLGSRYDTMFFDCHGGCGAYIDLADNLLYYGSSIIVDEIMQELSAKRTTKNAIIVCEKDIDYIQNFLKVVQDKKCGNITTYNKDFNEVIYDRKVEGWYKKIPALFFIDPFGFDLIMKNLGGLMSSFGNELIINFMFDYINRFIGLPEQEKNINEFYGGSEWKGALSLSGYEREQFLVSTYKDKLREYTKAKYIYAYRLCKPDVDRTYYYLFHATNHIDGLRYMKESFASLNNGRVEYLGKKNNVYTIFDLSAFKIGDAEKLLFEKYRGMRKTFISIQEDIMEDIAYTEKDLRVALQSLEKEGKIKVFRIESKTTGIKGKDLILFGG